MGSHLKSKLRQTMKTPMALLLACVATAQAVDLDPTSFESEVIASGKNAFVKFLAPW